MRIRRGFFSACARVEIVGNKQPPPRTVSACESHNRRRAVKTSKQVSIELQSKTYFGGPPASSESVCAARFFGSIHRLPYPRLALSQSWASSGSRMRR